jgi:hypothetical protein
MQNAKKQNVQANNKRESDAMKADKAIELMRFNVIINIYDIIYFNIIYFLLSLENKRKKCI